MSKIVSWRSWAGLDLFFLACWAFWLLLAWPRRCWRSKRDLRAPFWEPFCIKKSSILYMFRRLSRFTLRYVFLTTFGTPVLFVSCSLGCPRKTVRCLVTHKNQWIFMIFQCLRGRRARRREDNRRENGTNNKRTKSDYTTSKLMFFGLPGAHLNDIAQNGLPELPREPPGSCRGPFREAQEGPKRRQGRPKTAPRAAKSAPKAAQRQSQSGPGGHLGPTWP